MAETIYRIAMRTQRVTTEPVPPAWQGLGGRALTSTIVADEVPPTCHPLGPHNKLIFAPGLLSGTSCADSGRLSCGAKSPLTGTIKESNAGGAASQALARLGVKALIIEDLPDSASWYRVHVDAAGVTLHAADDLAGAGNAAVVAQMRQQLGAQISVITLGPAGEMRMALANISVSDPDGHLRSHGRGGLGAVMGAKRIKCITIDPADAPDLDYHDREAFNRAAKVFAKALHDHPVTGQALPTYGTDVLINILHEAGGLPTRNFTSGQFDGHDKISGEHMRELIEQRGGKPSHGCHRGCVIRCSQHFHDADGTFVTSGFEYESIWGLGANCCIDDLDILARADQVMDDIGIDTIETAVTIGVAMEAGLLPFGDGQGLLDMLREIATGSPLGRLLGSGAAAVGKAYGLTRVPVVKNQGIPAYDPRAVKGIGITYATSPMGADHTAGYTVATNILKVGGFVDPLEKEGQVELSRTFQTATAMIDSTGLCLFIAFAMLDNADALPAIVDMVNARFGTSLSVDEMTGLGGTILKREHAFNQAAGFTCAHDRLPEFFTDEPCPPHDVTWDYTPAEIDAFWEF